MIGSSICNAKRAAIVDVVAKSFSTIASLLLAVLQLPAAFCAYLDEQYRTSSQLAIQDHLQVQLEHCQDSVLAVARLN